MLNGLALRTQLLLSVQFLRRVMMALLVEPILIHDTSTPDRTAPFSRWKNRK